MLDNPRIGILFIVGAIFAISVNDLLIKLLSGDYPLHQMVFWRSAIGLCFGMLFVQLEGGLSILKTEVPFQHFLRGFLVVIANMTYFAALAVMPLAEATALFFVAPLFITLLSIPILKEKVGPLRLGAIVFGFVGVVIMQQPWQDGTSLSAPRLVLILPIIAAFTYALNQVMTRKLGVVAKASALSVYVQLVFLGVSSIIWLVAGDGRFAEGLENPSLIFLLRAWTFPQGIDLWLFITMGVNSAFVGYGLAAAYRLASAATVAPFEYLGLPLAVLWGWSFWGEMPSAIVWLGMVIILAAGLFVFWREHHKRRIIAGAKVSRRH